MVRNNANIINENSEEIAYFFIFSSIFYSQNLKRGIHGKIHKIIVVKTNIQKTRKV